MRSLSGSNQLSALMNRQSASLTSTDDEPLTLVYVTCSKSMATTAISGGSCSVNRSSAAVNVVLFSGTHVVNASSTWVSASATNVGVSLSLGNDRTFGSQVKWKHTPVGISGIVGWSNCGSTLTAGSPSGVSRSAMLMLGIRSVSSSEPSSLGSPPAMSPRASSGFQSHAPAPSSGNLTPAPRNCPKVSTLSDAASMPRASVAGVTTLGTARSR